MLSDDVHTLQRQVRDLTERLSACRSCLPDNHHNMSMCGGGSGWRQHRKQLRRKQREQKRLKKKTPQKSDEKDKISTKPSTDYNILSDSIDFLFPSSWKTETK